MQLLSGLTLGQAGEPPEHDTKLSELDGARCVEVNLAELTRDICLACGYADEAAC